MAQADQLSQIVNGLDKRLESVRPSWNDQTAATFATLNENMRQYSKQIQQYYAHTEQAAQMVRDNYNEAEFDGEMNRIESTLAVLS